MSRRGFTMIEILTVVVTAGTLLAVGIRPVSTAYHDWSVRGATGEFVSAHALARATALRFARTAELHIDAAAGRFWVEVDTSAVGGTRDTIGMMHQFDHATLEFSSTRSLICFDARGMTTTRGACEAANVMIVFSSATKEDTVRTTVLGKVLR